jgi:hypothetical protein
VEWALRFAEETTDGGWSDWLPLFSAVVLFLLGQGAVIVAFRAQAKRDDKIRAEENEIRAAERAEERARWAEERRREAERRWDRERIVAYSEVWRVTLDLVDYFEVLAIDRQRGKRISDEFHHEMERRRGSVRLAFAKARLLGSNTTVWPALAPMWSLASALPHRLNEPLDPEESVKDLVSEVSRKIGAAVAVFADAVHTELGIDLDEPPDPPVPAV